MCRGDLGRRPGREIGPNVIRPRTSTNRHLGLRPRMELHAELAMEERPALVGNRDRTVAGTTLDPAELKEPRDQRRTESAGDVEVPLAPVETAAHEGPSMPLQRVEIDPERAEARRRAIDTLNGYRDAARGQEFVDARLE